MKITIYPKAELEEKWAEDKKLYAPDAVEPPICLRCGKKLSGHLMTNALSRYANVMVCTSCGHDEGMRDFCADVLPLREWYAVRQGLLQSIQPDNGTVLTPICSFMNIFTGPQKTEPLNCLPVPVSKVLHSRSDYNGRKWWRTWHPCHDEPLGDELCGEINDFSDSLMELPEFTNLDTFRAFCRQYAEATSDSTEYNMYSVTPHFNIWLRLITRSGDYNMYVHFYKKE